MSPLYTEEDNRAGHHNSNYEASRDRLVQGDTYRDCSTVIVMPTRGLIPARVCQALWGLMPLMNQKSTRFVMEGMEVGEAYSSAVDTILANPEISTWRYMLTVEEDNLPPPDGLLKLIETMHQLPKEYAAVSGLYWTKGWEHSQPMCYGKAEGVLNFIPFLPEPGTVTECNGIGMGFALWRIEAFKDQRLERPIFQTKQQYTPGVGGEAYTQDLFACTQFRKLGYRFAVDSRVLVGHLDQSSGQVF